MPRRVLVVGVLVALFSVSCGGSAPTPTSPTPVEPPQPPVAPAAVTLTELSFTEPEGFIDNPVLDVGETVQLHLEAKYSDDSTRRVTAAATWVSSNEHVATVASGLVTGRNQGGLNIRASYEDKQALLSGLRVERPDDMMPPPATLAELSFMGPDGFIDDPVLNVGDRVQLQLVAEYSDGSTQRVTGDATWESSNEQVATVADGLITGRNEGGFNITAGYEERQIQFTDLRVEASDDTAPPPVTLTELSFTAPGGFIDDPVLNVGDRVQLQLVAEYSDGSTQRVTGDATWESSNEQVATVAAGLVTGRNEGRFNITADYEGRQVQLSDLQVEGPDAPVDTRWRGIRVEPEAGRTGYVRPSLNVSDTDIYAQDGRPACTAYTRTPITTVGVGDGLDREHIVALAEAWDSRPPGFTQATLQEISNDHANLTLALASANRSKGANDAAEWQPDYNEAWMANRVVEVKRKYDLSVDSAERDELERMLGSGPDAITCGSFREPVPAHAPVRTSTHEPQQQ